MHKIDKLTADDFRNIAVIPQQADEWLELISASKSGLEAVLEKIIQGICIRKDNNIIALGGVATFEDGIYAFAFVGIDAEQKDLIKLVKYARDIFLPKINKPIYVSARNDFPKAIKTLKFIGFEPMNINSNILNAQYENWVMK